jgi:flagellar protein FliS
MATYPTTARDAYSENAVLSASRGELVVILYDGACRFLTQASVAMRRGNIEATHRRLRRAEAIIGHLDATLDMSQGEIPDRLRSIYIFCGRHLNQARIDRDAGKIEDVIRLLSTLRGAWAAIASE